MKQLSQLKKWNTNIKRIINNSILCIRFPFLYPRNVFTDNHYNNWRINKWINDKTKESKVSFHVVEIEKEHVKNQTTSTTSFIHTKIYSHILNIGNDTISLMSNDNFKTISIYNTLTGVHYINFDITQHVKNIDRIVDICFMKNEIEYKNISKTKTTNYQICLVVDKKEESIFYSLFPEIILNNFLLKKIKLVKWFNNTILQLCHVLPKYTILDSLDEGWRKKFGIDLCKEIRSELIKCGWKYLFKYRVVQVKEKFGSLRWYDEYEPKDSKIFDIIKKYEEISSHTCIDCGKEAIWLTSGYILPYCNDCIEKVNHFGYKIKDYGFTKNPYSDYWLDENNNTEENET